MSAAYLMALAENLPDAVHVLNRFHVMKLYIDNLAPLHRHLQWIAEDDPQRAINGTRWLLLKNSENLDDTRDERRRLDEALELNQPLADAFDTARIELLQLLPKPERRLPQAIVNGALVVCGLGTVPMAVADAVFRERAEAVLAPGTAPSP